MIRGNYEEADSLYRRGFAVNAHYIARQATGPFGWRYAKFQGHPDVYRKKMLAWLPRVVAASETPADKRDSQQRAEEFCAQQCATPQCTFELPLKAHFTFFP